MVLIPVTPPNRMEVPFAFGDATPKVLGVLGSGKLVESVGIHITTAFDGVGAALSVGDAGNPSRLMTTTDNDTTAMDTNQTSPGISYGVATTLLLTITPGAGATQGASLVVITYQQ